MNYTEEKFLQYLFDNIPSYREYHFNEYKWWKNDNKSKNLGLETMVLLHFTVDELEEGNTQYLKFIFNLIEDMLNSDNEDAQYAAYMMFLDSLFNTSSHSDTTVPYNLWVHLLGSKSKEAIKEIEQF